MVDFECLLFGKCNVTEYEYTFYFNDKEYKTNDCNVVKSECRVDNKVFRNIPVMEIKLGEHREDIGIGFLRFPLIIPLICLILSLFLKITLNTK